jgi:D-glycero-D-manno-heptose 1,7-bisphosphate phosphatase
MKFDKRTRVLYLDLDGTVRWGKDELGHFGKTRADVHIFDGVPELLAGYKQLGWRIAAVSNQGGVALGHLTMDDCIEMMSETQRQSGNAFDKIVFCTHHPEANDPEMAVCWCRKPRSGLIFEAAHGLRANHPFEMYPPHLALMVGDRPEDKGCAEGAGITFLNAAEWRSGRHLAGLVKN